MGSLWKIASTTQKDTERKPKNTRGFEPRLSNHIFCPAAKAILARQPGIHDFAGGVALTTRS